MIIIIDDGDDYDCGWEEIFSRDLGKEITDQEGRPILTVGDDINNQDLDNADGDKKKDDGIKDTL